MPRAFSGAHQPSSITLMQAWTWRKLEVREGTIHQCRLILCPTSMAIKFPYAHVQSTFVLQTMCIYTQCQKGVGYQIENWDLKGNWIRKVWKVSCIWRRLEAKQCMYGGIWKLICVWKSLAALFSWRSLEVMHIQMYGEVCKLSCVWRSLAAKLRMYGGAWKLICVWRS